MSVVKNRYRSVKVGSRGGTYYCEDTHTGKRTSLHTKDRDAAWDNYWGRRESVVQKEPALHVPDQRSDRDALIAATALASGMTIVTRNVDDFEPTGAATLNPWT